MQKQTPSLGCMTADGHLRLVSKLQPRCGVQDMLFLTQLQQF